MTISNFSASKFNSEDGNGSVLSLELPDKVIRVDESGLCVFSNYSQTME